MPEMHLRPFTKNKERIQKFQETGDSQYIYKNELDKASFQHDLACGDFKDLTKRSASDDKTFNIAKNPKFHGYQWRLLQWSINFFDKTSGSDIKSSEQELAEELHKPIISSFNQRKVKSPFIDNIWCADLADMQLISKCNKGFRVFGFFRLLTFIANIHGLFLCKIKKALQLLMLFRKF